jgi:hypothetical protein
MPQVGMVTLLVMTPLLFVSGGWTPVEAMPGWLAGVTLLSPLRWFTDISYGLFVRGATLSDLALPITAMTGWGPSSSCGVRCVSGPASDEVIEGGKFRDRRGTSSLSLFESARMNGSKPL